MSERGIPGQPLLEVLVQVTPPDLPTHGAIASILFYDPYPTVVHTLEVGHEEPFATEADLLKALTNFYGLVQQE